MNQENKRTIILVDDSLVVRKMLKGYLEDKYTVIVAESPRECLKILAESKPKIDLGLIDVVMPEMDGFQLVKMIKKHPSYADVPFVMVTTKRGKENIDKAVLAGACGYIVKPFDQETILKKINKHLKIESDANSQKHEPAPNSKKDEESQKVKDYISKKWDYPDEN